MRMTTLCHAHDTNQPPSGSLEHLRMPLLPLHHLVRGERQRLAVRVDGLGEAGETFE